MAAIDFNWHPSDRQLRQFGLISMVALPALGWLVAGRLLGESWQPFHLRIVGPLAATGIVLATLGCWAPRYLRPIFLAVGLVAFPIGLVVGEIALLAIFVLVFIPIGIVFRLVSRDALQRRVDRSQPSYWTKKKAARDVASYFRQS